MSPSSNVQGVAYKALEEDYKWYSEAISKGVRVSSFGTIAAIWAVFTADEISLLPSGLFGVPASTLVRLAFVFASAALLLDILQYISGFWMTNIAIDRWDMRAIASEEVVFHYNIENLGRFGLVLYWVNFCLFPIKLIISICGGFSFFFFAFAITVKNC